MEPLRSTKAARAASDYGQLLNTYGTEFKIPDFTIKQIRDAIPSHCFERSPLRGFAYILRDIALLATTFYLFTTYNTPVHIPSISIRFFLWALYGFIQGLFGTGLWVLAHECGHQSFSPSKTLNDTTGWILHSALLVPYFSWKISHGKHHKSTGHMERDMVFLPKTREIYASRIRRGVHELHELTEEAPIVTALVLFARQLIGWPLYLLQNNTGHNFHSRQTEGRGKGKRNGLGGGVNHFSPSSPLYDAKDAKYIALSDLGLGLTAIFLYEMAQCYGWGNVALHYFLPYLWVNHWLVAITYLQHTDPTLAHYGAQTWNFTRGAAATIDREFGFIGRSLFHGIIETHVLHHYVSTIPFYHADEATEAIKPVMGEHYRSNTQEGSVGFLKSLWLSVRWCQWVEPSEGAEKLGKDIYFYRNRNGLGVKPLKIEKKVN
ncbi:Oleate hydroxylase fah12 [Bacidia gigantensis]|uniref:Oleate hydroxylase fah12 n=1 Tax=Bacidia gigantensis TaxID=2732470 RepID=UPI001D03A5BB|nr:Oleate hydroxylase fah12 [Bacidia gigantensis]KAG8534318.1 Oleate hydroxylase fah12 [Bacidia gigantensis]